MRIKMDALFGLLLGILTMLPVSAQSASTTTTFSFTSQNSTAITLTAVSPCTQSGATISCPLPMAAGTQLATIAVTPVGWTGSISVSPSTPVCIAGTTPNYVATLCAAGVVGSTPVTFTATP